MHKLTYYIKVLFIFLSCILFSTQLHALTFEVKYNQSIDLLNFMDKLSEWEPGPAADTYLTFWEKSKFKKKHDQKYLLSYKEIRKKYYHPSFAHLFAHNNHNTDILASVFYENTNPKKAVLKLKSKINGSDYDKIQSSIGYFSERISKLTVNQSHEKAILFIQKTLNQEGIQAYIKIVCNFYNVDFEKLHIPVVFNYTLDNVNEDAFIYADTIVLSDFTFKKNIFYNIKNAHLFQNIDNISLLMHEIVHLISSKAPAEQKERLSKAFEANFNLSEHLSSQKKLYLLEEPLAVILGQILFTRKMLPEYYEKFQNWYENPWVNNIAKLKEKSVSRYLEENKSIDIKFVNSFAKQANELAEISKYLKD